MATATRTRPSVAKNEEGLRPYLINVRQFEQMITAQIIPEDTRVELLGGVLAEKMTKYTPHNFSVNQLDDILRTLVAPNWVVSNEKPVVLGKFWRPEPDIAVARGPRERYRKHDPAAADLALVIEVAESSYALDRVTKWAGYAAAKVPVYWIVNLGERVIEVHSDPTGRGKTARYRVTERFAEGDSIPVVLGGTQAGKIAVKDILP